MSVFTNVHKAISLFVLMIKNPLHLTRIWKKKEEEEEEEAHSFLHKNNNGVL